MNTKEVCLVFCMVLILTLVLVVQSHETKIERFNEVLLKYYKCVATLKTNSDNACGSVPTWDTFK